MFISYFRTLISCWRVRRKLALLAKNEAWQLARLTDRTTGKLIEPAEARRRFAGVMGDLMREAAQALAEIRAAADGIQRSKLSAEDKADKLDQLSFISLKVASQALGRNGPRPVSEMFGGNAQ